MCTYLCVGKVKEGGRGYVCYTVGHETRKISVGYDTGPWEKVSRKRGGLEEENGDGQPSIAANATISTANDSASTSDCMQDLRASMRWIKKSLAEVWR